MAAVGERLRLPVQDARLLRLHSNASFALLSAGPLVRVATNPDARERVAASIAVTRWLASRGFPCVVPADIEDQPWVVGARVVPVWRYLPTVPEPRPAGGEQGAIPRALPAQPPPPVRLAVSPTRSTASRQRLIRRPAP